MKYLIAPDSYKESMSALRAAKIMQQTIEKTDRNAICTLAPMADGGEGTADCLMFNQAGKEIFTRVLNPLGEEIESSFVYLEQTKTGVIEVAKACGMMLIPSADKNPWLTTSYGVGQLIMKALELGCTSLVITLGGTVTNDGGMGMLMAMGGKIVNRENKAVDMGARGLEQVHSVDLCLPIEYLKNIQITVLCDVKNKLLGVEGATYVFGPQKGVYQEGLERIEAGMKHFSQRVEDHVHRVVSNFDGSGAAGGLGFSLFAISKAEFVSGSDYVMQTLQMDQKIQTVDFVITGEGSIDSQSLQGKVPVAIARLAQKYQKPVIVFAGKVDGEMEDFYQEGITAIFSILRNLKSLEVTLQEGEKNLQYAVENFVRIAVLSREKN